jgi:protein PhnA
MVRDGARAPPHHEVNTWPTHSSLEMKFMDIKVRDSKGALLAKGDSVALIKDLKLNGSSSVLKRGTMIRNIHLTDNEDEIEGRTDKVKGLVLRTEFLKEA